jgi:hypothetical protein
MNRDGQGPLSQHSFRVGLFAQKFWEVNQMQKSVMGLTGNLSWIAVMNLMVFSLFFFS